MCNVFYFSINSLFYLNLVLLVLSYYLYIIQVCTITYYVYLYIKIYDVDTFTGVKIVAVCTLKWCQQGISTGMSTKSNQERES